MFNSIVEIDNMHSYHSYLFIYLCHLLNTPTPLDSVHRYGDAAFK